MPTSNTFHLGPVIHFAGSVRNMRILDVGIGTGTYGWMLRQSIEVGAERLRRSDWKGTIEGIEIFEPYRNPMWDYVYDRVHIGDVRTVLADVGVFDIIVACDVLEHFSRNEARSLIASLLKSGRVLIATTPNRHFEQGAWGGNEAERHRSLLDESDFPHLVATKVTGVTTCYVCSTDSEARRQLEKAALSCPEFKVPRLRQFAARVRRRIRRLLGAPAPRVPASTS